MPAIAIPSSGTALLIVQSNGRFMAVTSTSNPGASRGNTWLMVAVFTAGMCTLAIEMSASRLLGSVYGASNLIWANVIGLILLYLAAGYFIGGRWADRSPHHRTFYRILVWGAFLCALVPLVARPVLRGAATAVAGSEAGLAIGSFVSVLILFAVPITLLGTASPFAIRLAVPSVENAGRTSGRIYATSTLGSLLGTFLPVLFFIPEIGTTGTFMIFSGILFVIGLIGLLMHGGARGLIMLWMPVVIVVLLLLVSAGPLRAASAGLSLLYEDESAYNYIQVLEDGAGNRYLSLNEGQGVHSQYHPTQYGYGRTWDFFLTAPYFNAAPHDPGTVRRMALIGLAAGTIARQYAHVYPTIQIDGIEIDPDIIQAGYDYFGMAPADLPQLHAITGDGRYAFNQLEGPYDVVGIDAYRPPYIPWHLTTVEYFEEIRSKLTADGVVIINVGRTPKDRRLVDALTATMLEVFPSVHAMDVPASFNTILVATMQPTTDANLGINLASMSPDASPLLRDTLALGVSSIVPARASDVIFTDDRAPVETLVDSLVLNFLLGGGAEQLQADHGS
ncbi:MAG: fused MFS/spermidine synthase [Anaerolineae bacterium]